MSAPSTSAQRVLNSSDLPELRQYLYLAERLMPPHARQSKTQVIARACEELRRLLENAPPRNVSLETSAQVVEAAEAALGSNVENEPEPLRRDTGLRIAGISCDSRFRHQLELAADEFLLDCDQ